MARSRFLFALMAAAVPITGCWVVIGESFDGYSRRGDGGTEVDGGVADVDAKDVDPDIVPLPLGFSAEPHAVGACLAKFTVANNVGYPTVTTPPGPVTIVTPATEGVADELNTDQDPRCYVTTPALPYCLIFASTFEIQEGAHLGVFGSRALAIVATGDITIQRTGILDVGAFDGPGVLGPGPHPDGNAPSVGGGGGNAEPGASACGQPGGPAIAAPRLIGGGNGGARGGDASVACRQGGGGGGAVQLVSLCGSIRMIGNANINATGGGGNASTDTTCPDGFGGGAGGTVWVQGADFVFDTTNGSTVDVFGGGGGGGGCRDSAGVAWTAAALPDRDDGGLGAICAGSGASGGHGGAGSRKSTSPQPGGAGTPGTGEATCGGAAGGRGRIVIQTPNADCGNYPFSSVSCVARKDAK